MYIELFILLFIMYKLFVMIISHRTKISDHTMPLMINQKFCRLICDKSVLFFPHSKVVKSAVCTNLWLNVLVIYVYNVIIK